MKLREGRKATVVIVVQFAVVGLREIYITPIRQ